MESSVKRCQYAGKGRVPCCRDALNETDYCRVHQPLHGERIKCNRCNQMIPIKSSRHERVCSAFKEEQQPFFNASINRFNHIDGMNGLIRDENALAQLFFQLFETIVAPVLIDASSECLNCARDHPTNSRKHRLQEHAMLELMQEEGLVSTLKPAVYIDFGAGKGSLSRYMGCSEKVHPESVFLCIERAAYKHKAEHVKGMKSIRARIDLEDVDLRILCESSGSVYTSGGVVGMGKHLCGAATDLALNGLRNLCHHSGCLQGICIALCCHSKCSWSDCAARNWLIETAGLSEGEFEILRRWSGCFTVDQQQQKLDSESQEKEIDLGTCEGGSSPYFSSYAARAHLGRVCKRLLDYGRMQFIERELNLKARLVVYIDEGVTPENVLMIGKKIE